MTTIARPFVPVDKEHMIRCDFMRCLAGMGLAGTGGCFLRGIWWFWDCPRFVDQKEWYAQRCQEESHDRLARNLPG